MIPRNRSLVQISRSRTFGRILDHIRSAYFPRLLLIGLLIFCACFTVSRSANKTANSTDQKDNSPFRTATDRFVRLAKKGRIDKVSVSYMRWELEKSVRYAEWHLMNSPSLDWEIVARNETASDIAVEIADTLEKRPLIKLADALEKYKLGRKGIEDFELDFGLVAVFYAQGKQVLRIGVSKYPPAISINGELFFASSFSLVYELASLLPYKAFRGLFSYTIFSWAIPPYGETSNGLRTMPYKSDPNDFSESLLIWIDQKAKEESTNK